MALKQGNGLEDWEIAVTKKLIGQFRRRSRSLRREEFDDLMHECLLHWLVVRRRKEFEPDRPPINYMATVVHNKLDDLRSYRGAGKRRGEQEAVSLDEPVGEADDATFGDLVDAELRREPVEHQPVNPTDLRIDVAKAMKQLTPQQRRLCDLLGAQGLSVKAAAEKLRIPRATLYEEIKRIRKIFSERGLDDYLRL